jgi:hypothetical protein
MRKSLGPRIVAHSSFTRRDVFFLLRQRFSLFRLKVNFFATTVVFSPDPLSFSPDPLSFSPQFRAFFNVHIAARREPFTQKLKITVKAY